MSNLKYGELPKLKEFVKHISSYVLEDGSSVVGLPPHVFSMEIHPSCDDYEAVYYIIGEMAQKDYKDIVVGSVELEPEWLSVVFTTYKSLHEFLRIAVSSNNEPVIAFAESLLKEFGYSWSE